ncbi:MAG: MFS transporter [Gemmataceae bacterium]|nr:MFS transporter [Gemmataceae bacterium]
MHPPARGRYLALAAALLGWMFDGLEMGLFPLVAHPALRELLGPGTDESVVGRWFAVITAGFLLGAATGGVLFGWLGDRIGRVRAMTVSVVVYAGCSGLCAFAQAPWQLACLRFAGALGMGGEWALGVALVMELWPDRGRGWLAGWIGAFGNLGYAIVAAVAFGLNEVGSELPGYLLSAGVPAEWVGPLTAHGNWRLLMLVGALPAVLTLFIRLLVPESERWLREKEAGAASRWSGRDLVGVLAGAAAGSGVIYLWAEDYPYTVRVAGTVVGVMAVAAGFLVPVSGYLSRAGAAAADRRRTVGRMLLAAGLSGVPLVATWGGVMWMYNFVAGLPGTVSYARPTLMMVSAVGAAVGCVVAAVWGARLGRRPVYAALCVLSAAVLFGFYRLNDRWGWELVASAGLLGAVTAAFYGWLPLYLPELFPTAIRATGQGFGFNFGRVIAAVGALQTGALLKAFDNDYGRACSVAAGVYLAGLVLILFAPETKGQPLPE